jgi:hypothetical protein
MCGINLRDFWGRYFAPSGHALPALECKLPELDRLNPHLFEAANT